MDQPQGSPPGGPSATRGKVAAGGFSSEKKAPAGTDEGKKKSTGAKAGAHVAAAGGLLSAVPVPLAAAVVVGAAAIFFGVKLLKGSGKEKEEKGSSSKAAEDSEASTRNGDANNDIANGKHDFSQKVQEEGKARTDPQPPRADPPAAPAVQPTDSTSTSESPVSTPSKPLQVAVGHSPFNTAPNSPLHPPDSPYHDADGELDFEDHHLGGNKPTSFSDWAAENGVNSLQNGVQHDEEDTNGRALTPENKELGSSIGSLDGEKASVQALLARARAAAARVDKMHASINAMVNKQE